MFSFHLTQQVKAGINQCEVLLNSTELANKLNPEPFEGVIRGLLRMNLARSKLRERTIKDGIQASYFVKTSAGIYLYSGSQLNTIEYHTGISVCSIEIK